MKGIVDRFEGIYAVIEMDDRKMANIEMDKLPEGIKEGDIIAQKDGAWFICNDDTEERKKKIDKLFSNLFE
jgi:Protein of unknown function (DUF3006).